MEETTVDIAQGDPGESHVGPAEVADGPRKRLRDIHPGPVLQSLKNDGWEVQVRHIRPRINDGWDVAPKGGRTVVRLGHPEIGVYAKGVATCSTKDAFDRRIGLGMALTRALTAHISPPLADVRVCVRLMKGLVDEHKARFDKSGHLLLSPVDIESIGNWLNSAEEFLNKLEQAYETKVDFAYAVTTTFHIDHRAVERFADSA